MEDLQKLYDCIKDVIATDEELTAAIEANTLSVCEVFYD